MIKYNTRFISQELILYLVIVLILLNVYKILKNIKNVDPQFCRYFQTISPKLPAIVGFTFHKKFRNKVGLISSGVDS